MSRTYSHAGVSKLDGEVKFRVANDAARVKILQKNGHVDIDIIELKYPMTKQEAVAYLLEINFDNGNAVVRAALEAAKESQDLKAAPKVPKEKKPKAEKAPKEGKPTLEGIRAKKTSDLKAGLADLSDLEEAPF